jgi:16S rRNA (cytosine967-C5)-methyltransferase
MSSLNRRALREDLVLQACLEAWGRVHYEGRLADRSLDAVLREKKHLWSQERRAVAERVYGLLRRERLVDFLANDAVDNFESLNSSRKDLYRFAISRVLDGEDPSAVVSALGMPGDSARLLRNLDSSRAKLSALPLKERFGIEASLTDFLADKYFEEFGDKATTAALAMNERAPLTIRTNTLKVTRDELSARLTKDGIRHSYAPLSPLGIHLETRENVFSLEAFKDGLFEIQDEGSQLLGMLADAPPKIVVDGCAGAGGKTLQLAAQMKNRGELYALDIDDRRLEDLRARARRADCHNVRVFKLDPLDEALTPVAHLVNKCDRVLVDAPCSGSGTFRRKPDARLRLDSKGLEEHAVRQRVILNRFAQLVKPGGRLIYGTCSIFKDENEMVLADFLKKHPEFSSESGARVFEESVAQKVLTKGNLRLFPHLHGTDGFFGAVLIKKLDSASAKK